MSSPRRYAPINKQFSAAPTYAETALETANGITPTDTSYEPGNVMRYGAAADAVTTTGGTDDTAAFQAAVDSGHDVWIPSGYYAIEGTVDVYSTGGASGGIRVYASPQARMEKFTNANQDPIWHFAGSLIDANFNNATVAVRNYGGYTRGVVLFGQEPNAADSTHASMLDTNYAHIRNMRILGATANTSQDGSVGLYCESAARRRGEFISPTTLNLFYNSIINVHVLQIDYGIFCSTDANANSFVNCSILNFGTAGIWCNGYGNGFLGCMIEGGVAWDTRERGAVTFGWKDTGPEASADVEQCDSDGDIINITDIANDTVGLTTATAHGLSTGDIIKVTGVVDTGPGGNNDFAQAVNGKYFEVTYLSANTFRLNINLTGLTYDYSSGGSFASNPYPIWGGFRNYGDYYNENAYSASTRVIRACLIPDPADQPNGSSSGTAIWDGRNWGNNNMRIHGTLTGGVSNSGKTDQIYTLNNAFHTPAILVNNMNATKFGNWEVRELDDQTKPGTFANNWSFGSKEAKFFSGRLTGLDESTNYDFWVWDDAGPTGACAYVKVTAVGKVSGAATEENQVSVHEYAVFVDSDTTKAVTTISSSDNTDARGAHFTLSMQSANGTSGSSYGKFSLRCATGALTGTNNDFFITYFVEVVQTQLDESNLDWDADIVLLNGDQGGGP